MRRFTLPVLGDAEQRRLGSDTAHPHNRLDVDWVAVGPWLDGEGSCRQGPDGIRWTCFAHLNGQSNH